MVLTLLGFGTLALVSAQAGPASVPMSLLKQCAEIKEPSKRLACYDLVAERPAVAGAASPKDFAPVAAAAVAAAPLKESFGLYAAEHPATPRV